MEIDVTHYCWVIGNTGFRESALYEKIESYLDILKEFKSREYTWKDNQREFFYMMQEHNFMVDGSTSERNMKKAARLKTSPLEKLGLVDVQRNVTQVGNKILERSAKRKEDGKKYVDKEFFLENDGDIYIRQLIKLQFFAGDNEIVKPFILFLQYMKEFKYINYNEMIYIIPLIVSNKMFDYGKNLIIEYRRESQKKGFDFFKWQKEHIISHKDNILKIKSIKIYIEKNIKEIKQNIDEQDTDKITNLMVKMDDNGKSPKYSMPLTDIFIGLCYLNNNINDFNKVKECIDFIVEAIEKTTKTQQPLWRKLIFGVNNKNKFKNKNDSRYKENLEHYIKNIYSDDMKTFIFNFFDTLWFIKIKNNLEDYADHNLRYLKLSNILENKYENGEKRVAIAEIYEVIIDKILNTEEVNKIILNKEEYNKYLYNESYYLPELQEEDMKEIAEKYIIKINEISTEKVESTKPKDINYRAWIELLNKLYIDKKVIKMIDNVRQLILSKGKGNLLECLEYLEQRSKTNDAKLKSIIDTEADVPTIFEFLVWQSFLLFGNYEKNPISFANFSFDNNLKPIQHAGGGMADVIFKYSNHDLILEATLTNDENQRKLEMEPVPRHVARYRNEVRNETYCIFVAPFVDPNVAVVHRAFNDLPYYVKDKDNDNKYIGINSTKILPFAIKELQEVIKYSIRNDILYTQLKEKVFDPIINTDDKDGYIWYKGVVEKKINELNIENKIETKEIAEVSMVN